MNKFRNIIVILILSTIFILLYYLLNASFIYNINQIINYIFILIVFIIVFNTINKLLNGSYINFNRIYLNVLDALRFFTNYFSFKYGTRFSYRNLNSSIREGNSYASKSKLVFISIKIGIILLVTLIWHLLIINNSTFLNGIILPIIIVSIFALLFIIPILKSLIIIAKKINKIESNKGKKVMFKAEKIILSIEIILFLILNILLYKRVSLNDLLWLDISYILIVVLLYKPIKVMCIKHKEKKYNN